MGNFKDQTEEQKVLIIKDEFMRTVEEVFDKKNEDIRKLIPKDQLETVVACVQTLKLPSCSCGECPDMDKIEGAQLPKELDCLVEIARKRAEEGSY